MHRQQKRRKERQMKDLTKEFTVKLTKQEMITITNNLLVIQDGTPQGRPRTYPPMEGKVVFDLLSKIRPFIQDMELPEDKPEEGIVTN